MTLILSLASCQDHCSSFKMIGGSVELFSLEGKDYPDLEVKRFNKHLPLFGFALDLEFECECDMNCWYKDSPFTDTLVDIQAFLKHSTSNYSETSNYTYPLILN